MLVPWMKGRGFFLQVSEQIKACPYWLFLTDRKLMICAPLPPPPPNKQVFLKYFLKSSSERIIYSVRAYCLCCSIACYSWHFLHRIIYFCRGEEKTVCFVESSEQAMSGQEEGKHTFVLVLSFSPAFAQFPCIFGIPSKVSWVRDVTRLLF